MVLLVSLKSYFKLSFSYVYPCRGEWYMGMCMKWNTYVGVNEEWVFVGH